MMAGDTRGSQSSWTPTYSAERAGHICQLRSYGCEWYRFVRRDVIWCGVDAWEGVYGGIGDGGVQGTRHGDSRILSIRSRGRVGITFREGERPARLVPHEFFCFSKSTLNCDWTLPPDSTEHANLELGSLSNGFDRPWQPWVEGPLCSSNSRSSTFLGNLPGQRCRSEVAKRWTRVMYSVEYLPPAEISQR